MKLKFKWKIQVYLICTQVLGLLVLNVYQEVQRKLLLLKRTNILSEYYDNLKNLSILSQSNIINRKIDDFQKIKKRKEYDIFFFDPPFVDNQFFKHLVFFKEENFIMIIT